MDTHLGDLAHQTEPLASDVGEHASTTNINKSNIAILPTELLAMIMTELVGGGFEPFDATVRAVCRLWLQVVDSTPELWAVLCFERPVVDFDRLRVILRQSGDAPLSIRITAPAMSERLLSVLLPVIARVRALHLECTWYAVPKPASMTDDMWRSFAYDQAAIAVKLIQTPAPKLEALFLGGLEIDSPVFSHTIPAHLRDLCMVECATFIPAFSFHPPELTRLTLNDCLAWESVDQVLLLLGSLPKLQHLELEVHPVINSHHMMPLPFNSPGDFARKSVRLPDLETINLCLRADLLPLLITVLDFPQTAALTIEGLFMQGAEPAVLALMDNLQSALASHFQDRFPDGSEGYTRMRFRQLDRYTRHEGFRVTLDHSEGSPGGPVPAFTLGVSCGIAHVERYTDIMVHLLGWRGAAANVRSVSAERCQPGFLDEPGQWTRLLGPLPRVSVLTIGSAHVWPAIHALRTHAEPSSQFVPALATVSVQDADADSVVLLVDTLHRRAAARLPALELVLSGCKIGAGVRRLFEEHKGVGQVRWD